MAAKTRQADERSRVEESREEAEEGRREVIEKIRSMLVEVKLNTHDMPPEIWGERWDVSRNSDFTWRLGYWAENGFVQIDWRYAVEFFRELADEIECEIGEHGELEGDDAK
jgi:hypothetical protein